MFRNFALALVVVMIAQLATPAAFAKPLQKGRGVPASVGLAVQWHDGSEELMSSWLDRVFDGDIFVSVTGYASRANNPSWTEPGAAIHLVRRHGMEEDRNCLGFAFSMFELGAYQSLIVVNARHSGEKVSALSNDGAFAYNRTERFTMPRWEKATIKVADGDNFLLLKQESPDHRLLREVIVGFAKAQRHLVDVLADVFGETPQRVTEILKRDPRPKPRGGGHLFVRIMSGLLGMYSNFFDPSFYGHEASRAIHGLANASWLSDYFRTGGSLDQVEGYSNPFLFNTMRTRGENGVDYYQLAETMDADQNQFQPAIQEFLDSGLDKDWKRFYVQVMDRIREKVGRDGTLNPSVPLEADAEAKERAKQIAQPDAAGSAHPAEATTALEARVAAERARLQANRTTRLAKTEKPKAAPPVAPAAAPKPPQKARAAVVAKPKAAAQPSSAPRAPRGASKSEEEYKPTADEKIAAALKALEVMAKER